MVLSSLERSENSSGNGEHVDFWRDSWLVDVSPLHTHILRNMWAEDGKFSVKFVYLSQVPPMSATPNPTWNIIFKSIGLIKGNDSDVSRFSLVSSIHSLLNKDWDVLIQVGHRSTNKVADLLARIGRVEERNVTSSGPSRIFLRP
ncbi:hypothetical protein V6N13_038814 [Hibiscus sabdariffa]